MRGLILFSLLLFQSACYSYAPAPPGVPRPAAELRVHLREPGVFRIGDVAYQNVVRVEGELVEWQEDELVLSAIQLTSGAGQEFLGHGQTIYVPREQIAELEEKRISRGRTALLAGGLGLLAVVAGVVLIAGDRGGGEGSGGGTRPR